MGPAEPVTARRWADADALVVGAAVVNARNAGVPWKTLERLYRRSRVQLWRLARAYETSFPPYETSELLRHGAKPESAAAV